MKKGDLIIISIVLIAFIGYFVFFINKDVSEGDIYLNIKVDNEIKYNIKLEEGNYQEIVIDDYGYNLIVIDGFEIHMHESDCPNQDCVETGVIKPNPGLFDPLAIICAPNHVSLSFAGAADSGIIDDIVN